jgi:hypothetical protein
VTEEERADLVARAVELAQAQMAQLREEDRARGG